MRARRWGRIVNVLNIGAKAPPGEGAPTAVSRAAGMALNKVLANLEGSTLVKRLKAAARAQLAELAVRARPELDPDDAAATAELLVRLAISFVVTPHTALPLDEDGGEAALGLDGVEQRVAVAEDLAGEQHLDRLALAVAPPVEVVGGV